MELELYVVKNFNGEFMQKDFSFSKDKENIKIFDLKEIVDVYNHLPNIGSCYADETTSIIEKSMIFVKLNIKTEELIASKCDIDEFWDIFINFYLETKKMVKSLEKV